MLMFSDDGGFCGDIAGFLFVDIHLAESRVQLGSVLREDGSSAAGGSRKYLPKNYRVYSAILSAIPCEVVSAQGSPCTGSRMIDLAFRHCWAARQTSIEKRHTRS